MSRMMNALVRGGDYTRPRPAGAGPRAVPKGQQTFSPLTDLFPSTRKIGLCGFTAVTVPDAFLTAAPSGTGWYKLLDIDPAEVAGQECALFAINLTLGSADVLGIGTNAMAWGRSTSGIGNADAGSNAAIVIGKNLPGTVGAWRLAGCQLPGLSGGGTVTNDPSHILHYAYFPPGNFFSTSPQRLEARAVFSPYVYRFPRGQRLQAALVVRPDAWPAGGADKVLYGHAAVSFDFGLVTTPESYGAVR